MKFRSTLGIASVAGLVFFGTAACKTTKSKSSDLQGAGDVNPISACEDVSKASLDKAENQAALAELAREQKGKDESLRLAATATYSAAVTGESVAKSAENLNIAISPDGKFSASGNVPGVSEIPVGDKVATPQALTDASVGGSSAVSQLATDLAVKHPEYVYVAAVGLSGDIVSGACNSSCANSVEEFGGIKGVSDDVRGVIKVAIDALPSSDPSAKELKAAGEKLRLEGSPKPELAKVAALAGLADIAISGGTPPAQLNTLVGNKVVNPEQMTSLMDELLKGSGNAEKNVLEVAKQIERRTVELKAKR